MAKNNIAPTAPILVSPLTKIVHVAECRARFDNPHPKISASGGILFPKSASKKLRPENLNSWSTP
jgi:hypothetical protein